MNEPNSMLSRMFSPAGQSKCFLFCLGLMASDKQFPSFVLWQPFYIFNKYLHVYVRAISWEVWDSLAPCTDDVWSRHVMVLAQSSPAWEARDSQVFRTFNHTARVLSGFQTFLSYRLHSRRLHTCMSDNS